ncbi:ATP-binding protein [Actinocorallia populi]|uniref:ATP-binding protein n=1 Tax=Actinocorallia populi TaxID=2079200 RepID=UPI001E2B81EB|nr:hypothetical protein [Actinocorallia populi]
MAMVGGFRPEVKRVWNDRVLPPYPFSAVVGLEDLKLALLVNAVSPSIGGVLVQGETGTAKSTLVRGLVGLLPPVPVAPGCLFSCDPAAPDPECLNGPHDRSAVLRPTRLVELPAGVTEEQLTGVLNEDGAYEPGLLAAAHRGVLYVEDVDLPCGPAAVLLLEAAVTGRVRVERRGLSLRHFSEFLLVGTGGPWRMGRDAWLCDRFGLAAKAVAIHDPRERAEAVRRRLDYERDPAGFAASFAGAEAELSARIAVARALLPDVVLGDGALRAVVGVCTGFALEGLRADLVTARTAIALAAWNGRSEVVREDVARAARLALPHRWKEIDHYSGDHPDDDPFEDGERPAEEALDATIDEILGRHPFGGERKGGSPEGGGPGPDEADSVEGPLGTGQVA